MQKVLIFIQGGIGGAERVSITIGKLLSKNYYDVQYCIVSSAGVNDVKWFIKDDTKIVYVERKGQLKLLYNLYKTIKSYDPNYVFSSIMSINQRLLLISIFFPFIKFVVRNDNYLYTQPALKNICLSFTYRLADIVIAQTEEMKKELIIKSFISSRKIKVVYNPIDYETIDCQATLANPFTTNGDAIYVASGRCHKDKGFDILIKAFHIVKSHIPNTKLYIIGSIENECKKYYEELRQLVCLLGLENNVVFIGLTSDPYKYVKHADCFVLSSRNEGLPNVLIESQYLGIPAAATKCIPIIERIVTEGVNGFLANVDDEKSLARAMIKAIKLKNITRTYVPSSDIEILNIFNRNE